MAAADPEHVSLRAVTDWDAGFPLAGPREPVDDILPGDLYEIECAPQRPVLIDSVVVCGLQLVQLSVGEDTVRWGLDHFVAGGDANEPHLTPIEWDGSENQRYRVDPPLAVRAAEPVLLRLKNAGCGSLKPKIAMFVREPPRRRPEDAVPCPACDKQPGDSCDGPTSHPSRRARYQESCR